MPTPLETLQASRAEATTNSAALTSVRAQAASRLAEVELWVNSPSKGLIRDQLSRLIAEYDQAKLQAQRLISATTNVINTTGTLVPDPVPAPITWSTADF